MRRFLRWLEDVFWPRGVKCLCCDTLSEGEFLCPTCAEALAKMRLSQDEQGRAEFRSVYRYDGVAKQLVRLLKFGGMADAAIPLAQGMANALREMSLPQNVVLTWVTMPRTRRLKRGMDHGRTLCEAVAALTGLESRQLLERVGSVRTQRGLDHKARMQNLAGTIVCHESISGSVLLIDDVMTTGATATLCAEVLRAAGASQVYVLTATHTMLKR